MEQLEFRVVIEGRYQAIRALEIWLDNEANKKQFTAALSDAAKSVIDGSDALGKKKITITVNETTLKNSLLRLLKKRGYD